MMLDHDDLQTGSRSFNRILSTQAAHRFTHTTEDLAHAKHRKQKGTHQELTSRVWKARGAQRQDR